MKKKMLNNEKGVTLIELIISIAIMGIILISFLGVFSSSFKSIISAGNKSEAVFMSHEEVASVISGEETDENNTKYTTLSINLPDGQKIEIDGKTITVESNKNRGSSSIKTFVTD